MTTKSKILFFFSFSFFHQIKSDDHDKQIDGYYILECTLDVLYKVKRKRERDRCPRAVRLKSIFDGIYPKFSKKNT